MATEDNPYAPPVESGGLPTAPQSSGWRMNGKSVWIGPSAQLPMIDPFTGTSDASMMLQEFRVRYRPYWLLAIPVVFTFSGFAIDWFDKSPARGPFALPALITGLLIMMGIRIILPTRTFRFFISKETLRKHRIYHGFMQVLLLLFLPGAILFQLGPAWMSWIPTTAFTCWILGLLSTLVVKRRLYCRRVRDDGFEIRGFHKRALAMLAEIDARKTGDLSAAR